MEDEKIERLIEDEKRQGEDALKRNQNIIRVLNPYWQMTTRGQAFPLQVKLKTRQFIAFEFSFIWKK